MEGQNRCVSCGRSVLRRRKHILTGIFLERHRDIAELLLQEMMPREVSTISAMFYYVHRYIAVYMCFFIKYKAIVKGALQELIFLRR